MFINKQSIICIDSLKCYLTLETKCPRNLIKCKLMLFQNAHADELSLSKCVIVDGSCKLRIYKSITCRNT